MSASGQQLEHTASNIVFGPVVDQWTVPDSERLNRELIPAIRQWSEEEGGTVRSNVEGWHSDGNLFKRTEAPFKEICSHFLSACKAAVRRYSDPEKVNSADVKVEGWVNINRAHAWNHLHTHDNNDFSGVYYVKVPKRSHPNSGLLQFINPTYRGGTTRRIWKAMNPQFYQIVPAEGMLVIFPSAMPHWVLPNDEQEERISIAFNLALVEQLTSDPKTVTSLL